VFIDRVAVRRGLSYEAQRIREERRGNLPRFLRHERRAQRGASPPMFIPGFGKKWREQQ